MAASVRAPERAATSGARRAARTGYRWLLLAFLLAVAVQIFLAGLGTFSFDTGRPASGAFSAHMALGFTLGAASLLILALAMVARPGRLALWLAVALAVQTFLLQSLLDGLADNTVVFGGLHALDGGLIAANAAVQYVLARRRAAQDAGRAAQDSG